MESKLDIVNMALSLVNQKNISSLDEKSIPAEKANLFFGPVLRKALEAYSWSFASKTVKVAGAPPTDEQDVGEGYFYNGYRYVYSFGEKVIKFGTDIWIPGAGGRNRILNTRDQYSKPPYLYEYRNLFSDEPELILNVIYYNEDESYYSASFIWVIVYALAAALSKVLIDSASYSQLMEAKSKECLLDAISEDQGRQSIRFARH